MGFIDAVTPHEHQNWPFPIAAHKITDPPRGAIARERFIIERQKMVAWLDAGGSGGRGLRDREYCRLCPTDREGVVRVRAVLARQARDGARVQPDLGRCPVLAILAVGNADAEGDVVEPTELGKIVADLVGLFFASLSFDFT